MEDESIPGISLGLIVDGEEHYISLGVTSVQHPLEVTPDTLFLTASVTKTYTASVAMKLVEMGKLELDAPVRRYIPSFRVQDEDVSARVTIRQLLTHMGGWREFEFDTGDGDDALERYVERMADLPQVVPLGTVVRYSNSGFCLLGRVIEVVHGKPLDRTVRELLFDPLELHDSVFWAHEAIVKRTSVGHDQTEAGETVVLPKWRLSRSENADGGIHASARDLLKFARFQMGQSGDAVLSSASRTAMQTPGPIFSSTHTVGLCWRIAEYGGAKVVSHGGDMPGFHAHLAFEKNRNFALTCLTNSESGSNARDELVAFAIATFLDLERPWLDAVPATRQELEEYVGWYAMDFKSPEDGVEITLEGDALLIRVNVPSVVVLPATPMEKLKPDLFRVTRGPMRLSQIEMLRVDGRVQYLRGEGTLSVRQDKVIA